VRLPKLPEGPSFKQSRVARDLAQLSPSLGWILAGLLLPLSPNLLTPKIDLLSCHILSLPFYLITLLRFLISSILSDYS
jgi:hypothetical protein